MSPLTALLYSFLFGLLHGILPDEHTWPITFSYAIGGASGKEEAAKRYKKRKKDKKTFANFVYARVLSCPQR